MSHTFSRESFCTICVNIDKAFDARQCLEQIEFELLNRFPCLLRNCFWDVVVCNPNPDLEVNFPRFYKY